MRREVRLSSVVEFALADHNKSISFTSPHLSPHRCDAHVTTQVLLSQTPSSVKSASLLQRLSARLEGRNNNNHRHRRFARRSHPAPEQ